MREVKTMFERMAVFYLLLALNIIPCASILPDQFPTRNVSAIYLLILSVCLVMYYSHRVLRVGRLSVMMQALSWMSLLLILLRGIKYSAVAQVEILARHTWYLYYVPMLLLPLFLFYISLLVSPKEEFLLPKGWYWTWGFTLLLIVLVLSNDWHQLVFRFQANFENWDNAYSHGWLFYVITGWQYLLYLAAIAVLLVKCRISSAKKNAWVILLPLGIGIGMNILLLTGKMPKINESYIMEFPEVLIFSVVIVLDCCMQLGLIPTNTDYGKLFENFSICAQITDQTGTQIYASSSANALSEAQFAAQSGARIGAYTVLHKMPIPGGFGFWQDDMSEMDRLNEELAEAKENLAQEAELIRLRNELKENQTKIEQRTWVYDTIAERTQRQSQAISRLAETARLSEDTAYKEQCRNHITLLGAYIKRYANLMLLSQERDIIEAGELGLSISEVLRYLNFCGIPGELFNCAYGAIPAAAALAVFEGLDNLLETNFSHLKGVFVNLSSQGENTVVKLTMEDLDEPLSQEEENVLQRAGVQMELQREDRVTYICFTLPEGGESA